ncbi:hypothetical protein BDV96DRAFT_650658 [Lophiotrema nucula]|uniref:Heterokaryon incompatibility domain-containing protein n=1 Tax=Lophiotrema nucula TaxID=690887 RepID=A0A6A5YU38_9PLEO|nr:hypothetical protein BDV96DRAFT_650658 [Lophiotrema nucula]
MRQSSDLVATKHARSAKNTTQNTPKTTTNTGGDVHKPKRRRVQSKPAAERSSLPGANTQDQGQDLAERFCSGCCKIDFESFYTAWDPSRDFGLGFVVQYLTHLDPESSCKLCKFLFRMANRPNVNPRHMRLRWHSARKLLKYGARLLKDTIIVTIVTRELDENGNKLPYPRDTTKYPVHYFSLSDPAVDKDDTHIKFRDTSGPVNWDVVKSWLEYCERKHTGACSSAITSAIDGLTVVDCDTGQLTSLPHPQTPYVTLSYVWGRGEAVDTTASAEDPSHELPGISMVPRMLRPLNVGRFVLTPARGDFYITTDLTTWNKRGWTYQEGLFARRRLIFSQAGLYLQCKEGRYMESITIPPHMSHNYRFSQETALYPRVGFFPDLEKEHRDFVRGCVTNYSCREFTYDSDILIAFGGVLEMFKSSPEKVENLCGMPFFGPTQLLPPSTRTDCIADGLVWQSTRRSPKHSWSNLIKSRSDYEMLRRYDFPSWTWAGWRFRRQEGLCYTDLVTKHEELLSSDIAISVEFKDGTIYRFEEDYHELLAYQKAGNQPRLLYLEAWTINIAEGEIALDYQYGEKRSRPDDWARVFTKSNTFEFILSASLDVPAQVLVSTVCKVVLVTNGINYKAPFLLLRKAPTGEHYERVGIGKWLWEVVQGKEKRIKAPISGQVKQDIISQAGAKREMLILG